MRLRQCLVVKLSAVALLIVFLAYSASKRSDEKSSWNSRGLLRGEPSGERTDSTLSTRLRPMSSDYVRSNQTEQDTLSTTIFQEGLKEKMVSIKVSVTVPSFFNKKNISKNQADRLEIYKSRKYQISRTCRKYGLGTFARNQQPSNKEETSSDFESKELLESSLSSRSSSYQEMEHLHGVPVENSLMWEQKWHMVYCWIHKVASSTWSQLFFNLHGKRVPVSRLHEAAQYFHPESSQVSKAVTNSLVFTFVRHPFERLVSAYRDKFELAKKYSYVYSRYVTKILGISSRHPELTAGENSEAKKRMLTSITARRPSFQEFVDYIIKEEVHRYNDHWVPYWLHCHFCQMEYDIIGKMDTWNEDVQFITDVTGLSMTNMTLSWTNRRSNSSSTISLDYFKTLDKTSVIKLYNIYRIDFEMFGYSVQPYLDLFSP